MFFNTMPLAPETDPGTVAYDAKLKSVLGRMLQRYYDGKGVRLKADELMVVMDSCLFEQADEIAGAEIRNRKQ